MEPESVWLNLNQLYKKTPFLPSSKSEEQKKGLHNFLENLWFSKENISQNSLGQIAEIGKDNVGNSQCGKW